MSTRAVIGLGSNIDAALNLARGLDQLADTFGALELSPVYETEAIGFAGPSFLNLVAAVSTPLSVAQLSAELRRVEREQGHPGNLPKFSSRRLDLDLLLYGDRCGEVDGLWLPRDDITAYAYVLWPLSDLLGDALHPRLGVSFTQLRQAFAGPQRLRRVPFIWRGCDLSAPLATTRPNLNGITG